MLRELSNTRQVVGEPPRKWYFSHEQDLVIWLDSVGNPIAFQLAYGKDDYEQSVSWHPERGYQHYVVNDGDGDARWFQTPLLHVGGVFRKDTVIDQFLTLSKELPPSVIQLVSEKLHAYSGPTYSHELDPISEARSERQAELVRRMQSGEFDVDNCSDSSCAEETALLPRRRRKRSILLYLPEIVIGIFAVAVTILSVIYS